MLLGLLLSYIVPYAQEDAGLCFDTGIDLKSRYVWRGLMFSDSPSIQPYMSVTWKGFTAMGWGSYATSNNYAEIDLFLAYSVGGLTLNLNDYYSENEADLAANDYTEWNREITSHLIEASIVYQLPLERFPLQLTGSTFIYGADLDEHGDQNYSTYLEASYPFSFKDYECSVVLGSTTSQGYYAGDAGIVNLGINTSHSLKVTAFLEVPVNMSLIFNPSYKDVFFVVGISL